MTSFSACKFNRLQLTVLALGLAPVLANEIAFANENPNVPKAATGKPIDLLEKVILSEDAISGKWTRNETGIQSGGGMAKLRLYNKPEGEYDFRISFARLRGKGGVVQTLHYGNTNFAWGMGIHENTVCGFGNIDGRRIDNNETTTKKALTNGTKHTAVVRVRDGSVSAFVDEELVSHLKTDYSNLTRNVYWDVGDDHLGVSSTSQVLIYSAELIPVAVE